MKKSILFLFILSSYFCHGQKDYELIDHTTQGNNFNAIHQTDSIIYYSLNDFNTLFASSTFNSIDSNGIRKSEFVFGGTSDCKFITVGENHLRAIYYNLLGGDLYELGAYQVDLIGDHISIQKYDLGEMFDLKDIEKNDNGEFLILEYNKYSIIDESGFLLLETDLSYDNRSYFVRNKTDVYLVVDNLIYHSNGYALNLVYTSTQNIFNVVASGEDKLFIIHDDKIEALHLTDLSISTLISYDLPSKTQVEYNGNESFIFKSKIGEMESFTLIESNGVETHLYDSKEDEYIKHVRLTNNQLYLNGNKDQENTYLSLFKKTSLDGTNDEAYCKDVKFRYANFELIDKEFQFAIDNPYGIDSSFRYTYTYDIAIENKSLDSIKRVDLYSNQFELGGFIPYTSLNYTITDLAPLEIKIISGEFIYNTTRGIIKPEILFIPGVDYYLDCNPDDNNFDVSQITTSTSIIESFDNIQFFPNPTSDYLFIENLKKETFYVLYSSQGKVVTNGKTRNKIDVTHLVSGMYFLKINDQVLRFIKD